jgi:hypothetical protein
VQGTLQRTGGPVLWQSTTTLTIGRSMPYYHSREMRGQVELQKTGLTLAARTAAAELAASLHPAVPKR